MPQRRGFVRRTLNARTMRPRHGRADRLRAGADDQAVLPLDLRIRLRAAAGVSTCNHSTIRSCVSSGSASRRWSTTATIRRRHMHSHVAASCRTVVGFTMWDVDSVADPPGRIIDARRARAMIDVAIVWGPLAGYFARRQPVAIDGGSGDARADTPDCPSTTTSRWACRRGDSALKERLDDILDRRHDDIEGILTSYGVPLVTGTPPAPLRQ